MENIRFTYGINRYDGEWRNGVWNYVAPIQVGPVGWDDYVSVLHEASNVMRAPEEKDRECYWVSPMLLGDSAERRLQANIDRLAAFAAGDLDAQGWTLNKLNERLDGFAHLFYTTTSSRPWHQRWRIMVQLDREISVQEHGAVWNFLNELFDEQLDQKTRNVNRIYYVPAKWIGADNVFTPFVGQPICVDTILEYYEPVDLAVYTPITELHGHRVTPDGCEIITDGMIREFTASPPGGRFWTLLCSAAARYQSNGWTLSADSLCSAAMQVSLTYGPGVKRQNPVREAARALAWAESTVLPLTPLERLQSRMQWQLRNGRV
jgi:hypothetical protein